MAEAGDSYVFLLGVNMVEIPRMTHQSYPMHRKMLLLLRVSLFLKNARMVVLNNRKRDPNVIYALFIRILYASLLYKKNEKRCNDMIVKSLSNDFGNDHAVRELDMPIPCEETCAISVLAVFTNTRNRITQLKLETIRMEAIQFFYRLLIRQPALVHRRSSNAGSVAI